ncbi:hypothetical protein TRFO_41453 [Tritrichomonas foetus]|uniref:Chromo shadow domain-containing protein n=1 Tax=Tritrichomonas foetus TaxID=1144522 RepID=A0A1J4L4Q0_9EUKA|nr:hypothetical protein TRFO_41453 [Tritrichomonas foetus]|eukprot:OHT16901.1 hypothetical protein TRFO_41453 [Tritrichomonas foetus]
MDDNISSFGLPPTETDPAQLEAQREMQESQRKSQAAIVKQNKKLVPRPIKEIKGILKGKTKHRTFVVTFADTDKDEAVPITHMHKLYTEQLLRFYEAHIVKCPMPDRNSQNNQNTEIKENVPTEFHQ